MSRTEAKPRPITVKLAKHRQRRGEVWRCLFLLPMTLFKVGYGLYVSAEEVVLLQSFTSRPSRRDKQAAEGAGLYKDGTSSGKRRDPLRTLVHLRCGLVVGSPITIDALANRSPISAPVKTGTRRNNIEAAQIVAPALSSNLAPAVSPDTLAAPLDTPPPAPRVPPRGTRPRPDRQKPPAPAAVETEIAPTTEIENEAEIAPATEVENQIENEIEIALPIEIEPEIEAQPQPNELEDLNPRSPLQGLRRLMRRN